MFGKLIALIILGIVIYNLYRIYERGKIRAELIKNGNKKVTHEEVIKEQKRRDQDRIIDTLQKIEEKERSDQDKAIDKEMIKAVEKQFFHKMKENKKSWKQLGDEYEEQIAKYYKSLGYAVIERGKTLGRKDGGIDLIAKKENQTILIQCKNRKSKIKHIDIQKFLFETDKFIEENKITEEVELLYVIANDVLDRGTKWLLFNERKNLNFKVIPYLDI